MLLFGFCEGKFVEDFLFLVWQKQEPFSKQHFKKIYGWFSVLYVVWWAACPSALERLLLKFYWSRVRFTAAHKIKSNVAHLEVLLWGEYSHFQCHLAIVTTAVQQSTSRSKKCKRLASELHRLFSWLVCFRALPVAIFMKSLQICSPLKWSICSLRSMFATGKEKKWRKLDAQ